MEAKKIILENFRTHESIELELDAKVTVVTGPNGCGKSTLISALSTLILGENPWSVRDGITLGSQIKKGEKMAKVTVVGKNPITRTISAKSSKLTIGKGDNHKAITQPVLLNSLRCTAPQVRAALCSQAFLSLDLRDMKEVLFDLLGSDISLDVIKGYIPDEAHEIWDKLADRWDKDHPDEDVDVDALYKWIYEARKNYKAKQISEPDEDPKKTDLLNKLRKAERTVTTANFDNEKIKASQKEREGIPDLKKQLEVVKKNTGDPMKLKKAEEDASEAWMEAEKDLSAAQAILDEANEKKAGFKGVKVSKGTVVCPIGLECPHTISNVHAGESRAHANSLAGQDNVRTLKAKVRDAKDLATEARGQMSEGMNMFQESKDLEEQIAKAEALEDLGDLVDVDELKKKRDAIQKEIEDLVSKPIEKDPKVGFLDSIVDSLKVDGIKTGVIKNNITKLEKEINKALSGFGGWTIEFFVEEIFAPTILTKDGECRVGELSDGERAILSLVIQDAFARRTGLDFVVCDNVDLLDPEKTEAFFETALKVPSKVLVAVANAPKILTQKVLPKGIKVMEFRMGKETLKAQKKKAAKKVSKKVSKKKAATKKSGEEPVEDIL